MNSRNDPQWHRKPTYPPTHQGPSTLTQKPCPLRSKDDLGEQTETVTPVCGAWCLDNGPRTPGLGSGKITGKFLIVDHMWRSDKLLI